MDLCPARLPARFRPPTAAENSRCAFLRGKKQRVRARQISSPNDTQATNLYARMFVYTCWPCVFASPHLSLSWSYTELDQAAFFSSPRSLALVAGHPFAFITKIIWVVLIFSGLGLSVSYQKLYSCVHIAVFTFISLPHVRCHVRCHVGGDARLRGRVRAVPELDQEAIGTVSFSSVEGLVGVGAAAAKRNRQRDDLGGRNLSHRLGRGDSLHDARVWKFLLASSRW